MTANPASQLPVDPAAPQATTAADRRIGVIAAWLSERSTLGLAVDVVTGPNRVAVARGRYLAMEAHPSAPGVHRLLFDSSQAGPDGPTGQQWVTIGSELVDVAAGDRSLILDKGSQRIEVQVIDAVAPQAPAASQTVAPVATPGERATPAAAEDRSVFEAYAPALEAVAAAPMYQNSAVGGSRLFGETRLEVAGDDLRVTARRMRHGTAFLVLTGIILGAFVIAGAVLYGVAVISARSSGTPADAEYLQSILTGTAAVAAAAALCYFAGRLLSAGRQPETLTIPLAAASGRKAGRLFLLRLPIGRKGHTRKLVLKPAGKADRARLAKILEGIRR